MLGVVARSAGYLGFKNSATMSYSMHTALLQQYECVQIGIFDMSLVLRWLLVVQKSRSHRFPAIKYYRIMIFGCLMTYLHMYLPLATIPSSSSITVHFICVRLMLAAISYLSLYNFVCDT